MLDVGQRAHLAYDRCLNSQFWLAPIPVRIGMMNCHTAQGYLHFKLPSLAVSTIQLKARY
jgi:hypothetical protein